MAALAMTGMEWVWPPWWWGARGRTLPDKANEDYMWLRYATNDNGSMSRIGPDGGLTDRENEWCTASRGRDLASPTGSEDKDKKDERKDGQGGQTSGREAAQGGRRGGRSSRRLERLDLEMAGCTC